MEDTENRVTTKRILGSDVDEYLSQLKGTSYREYRRRFDDARLRHIRTALPLQLSVELVSYCNLRCKMCYRQYMDEPAPAEMSLELMDCIVEQAKQMVISSIWLGSYTEATLHPNIIEALYKFAAIGAQDYWLATNGTGLTRAISEVITDIPLTKLTVSLDAATAETYKTIRGGDYNKVLTNIVNFLEIREKKGGPARLPFLRVTFVEQDDNRHEIDEFYQFWKDKADIIDVQRILDCSVIQKDIADISSKRDQFDCIDPYYQLVIRHDGKILPCCSFMYATNEPVYISQVGLADYWKSPQLLAFVQTIREKKYFECCKKCFASVN